MQRAETDASVEVVQELQGWALLSEGRWESCCEAAPVFALVCKEFAVFSAVAFQSFVMFFSCPTLVA